MTAAPLVYVVTVGVLLVLLVVERQRPAHRIAQGHHLGHRHVSGMSVPSGGVLGAVGVLVVAVALVAPIMARLLS